MNTHAPIAKALTASDTLRLIDEEIARFEPRVARALRDGIEDLRNRVDANELARLISANNLPVILQQFSDSVPKGSFDEFKLVMGRAAIRGAKISAEAQGPIVGVQDDFEIRVGETNPKLANYVDALTSTRIREIDNGSRDLIRSILREGAVEGDDPLAIARRIKTSIGLTRRQEAAVNRYRRNLEQLDPYALERKLRDRRSDGAVRRAIENEKPLGRKQIESLVDRYRRRWVAYRSRVIGRTETIRAVQGAQWELWQGLVEEGRIDERQILRTWHTTPDARLRDEHAAIPSMNPKDGVGLNEPFQSPLGPIMYPGDPSAPAANTIQCRCAVLTEVVSAELLGLRPDGQGPGTGSRPPSSEPEAAPPVLGDAGRRADLLDGLGSFRKMKRGEMVEAMRFSRLDALEAVVVGGDLDTMQRRAGKGAYARGHVDMIQLDPKYTGIAAQRIMRHEFGHVLDDRMARVSRERAAKPFPGKIERQDYWFRAKYRSFDAIEAIARDGQRLKESKTGVFASEGENDLSLNTMAEVNYSEQSELTRAIFAQDNREEGLDAAGIIAKRTDMTLPEVETTLGVQIKNPLIAARFAAAYERRDVYVLLRELPKDLDATINHESALAGMQDTWQATQVGGSRIQFGHPVSYWKVDAFDSSTGFEYSESGKRYGSSSSAQAMANWFEAYASPDPGDYKLFRRLYPDTSAEFERMLAEYLQEVSP